MRSRVRPVVCFLIGEPQVVMVGGVLRRFYHCFLQKVDRQPVSSLVIISPAQRVGHIWQLGQSATRYLRQRERQVNVAAMFQQARPAARTFVPRPDLPGWSVDNSRSPCLLSPCAAAPPPVEGRRLRCSARPLFREPLQPFPDRRCRRATSPKENNRCRSPATGQSAHLRGTPPWRVASAQRRR